MGRHQNGWDAISILGKVRIEQIVSEYEEI